MIFCIDSHVFIWAIKKQASEHDEDKKEDAEEFLKWIDEGEHTLLVPTVVLAECLSQEPLEKQAAIMKLTYETCAVINFDATAALKYAQVLNLDKFQQAKEKAKAAGIAREQMKIDYLIVCCAMANGAQRIYSHDPDILAFSEGLIDVQPIPKIKKFQQQSLFTPEIIAQIAAQNEVVKEKELQISIEPIESETEENKEEILPQKEVDNEQNKNTEENSTETTPGELPTEAGD